MAPDGRRRWRWSPPPRSTSTAGQTLDALGGYLTYGQAETRAVTAEQRLLPIGVAEGCRLVRDLPQDHVLTYDDVELPAGRLCDRLRAEQAELFGLAPVGQ